ncbi:MAG: transglutaminase-like domain-containing protein [Candidatus Eisenbacteria bacterium]
MSRTMPHFAAVSSVVAAALFSPLSAPGAESYATGETWFETSIAGHRVGVVRHTIVSENDTLLVTEVRSDIAVERFGERVEMMQEDAWTETRAGRPIRYVSERALSRGEEIALSVEVGAEAIVVRKATARGADSWTLPPAEGLVFPRAIARLHASRGLVPGDTYAYVTFDPDFEAVSRCSVSVAGPETLPVAGRNVDLILLHVWPDVYEGLLVREWRDEAGALWVQEIGGLGVRTARTEGAAALNASALPDIVSGTMIDVEKSIPRPELADDVLYEIWLDGGDVADLVGDVADLVGDVADLVGDDIRQTVESRTERGVMLRVRRTVPGDGQSGLPDDTIGRGRSDEPGDDVPLPIGGPGGDPDLAEFLEGNLLIQKDDPDVRAAALDAVAGAGPDPWARAVAIERRVAGLITDRGLGTAFASAAEVIDTRAGDCSEHAILAAAMARSVGIPSRLAMGVVHFQGGFAYHMWVEVRVEGAWYALDPTMGFGSVDAAHIRLGGSSLSDGRVAQLSVSVLRTTNRLGLRIVEYEEAGRTHRLE